MIPLRMRRMRRTATLRGLVREHRVHVDRLVQPLFVAERPEDCTPIPSMPGIARHSVEGSVAEARELVALGVKSVLLFGIPAHKDAEASSNYAADGVVQRATRALKAALPELLVMADLCNCEYTDHGQCGILDARGDVDNDRTVALLARTALSYAEAGVDVVAPSDMMDGRVEALRAALDAHDFIHTAILAYSAKYASAFYGPFREAAGSVPAAGERRTHQMDPPNLREALREIALDVEEGADAVMIKPGLAYLDVVRAARENFDLPIAAYSVSGEYAMLVAAFERGWLDRDRTVDETLTAFIRAGADIVITYFAKEWAARHHA